MEKILTLAVKDLRLLVRDRAGFFFTFFFPLMISILFGTIFSGGAENYAVSVAVVDEDGSPEAADFIATLASTPGINALATSREEAAESVRRGKRAAYIVVLPGFGEASQNMFRGNPPAVEMGIDPAHTADGAMLEGIMMRTGARRFERLFEAAGGGHNAFEPVSINKVDVSVNRKWPKNAYAITFPQGIVWAFIGVTAAFGISIVSERGRGTLMRLQVAPISRAYILAGKATACFLTTLAVSTGLLFLGRVAFGVRPDSVALLALAVLSSCLAFVGIMMLLSVLGKTEEAASGIGWAVLLVLAMLGGGMIPYFIMPSWMRTLSSISPVKWSILAMEGAIWRRFSLAEMLLPCGILVAVGVAAFAVGVRAFGWNSDR